MEPAWAKIPMCLGLLWWLSGLGVRTEGSMNYGVKTACGAWDYHAQNFEEFEDLNFRIVLEMTMSR